MKCAKDKCPWPYVPGADLHGPPSQCMSRGGCPEPEAHHSFTTGKPFEKKDEKATK